MDEDDSALIEDNYEFEEGDYDPSKSEDGPLPAPPLACANYMQDHIKK